MEIFGVEKKGKIGVPVARSKFSNLLKCTTCPQGVFWYRYVKVGQ